MQLAVQVTVQPAGLATTRRGAKATALSVTCVRRHSRVGAAAAAAGAACRHRSVRAAAAAAAADPIEVEELKAALLDSFWGTERGLAASSDSRAEINELITQVGCGGWASVRLPGRAVRGASRCLAASFNHALLCSRAHLLLRRVLPPSHSPRHRRPPLATPRHPQLEARNPTPEPNEARAALGGAWRLAYTSNSELIALLALGRLPLVSVGEISQTIDPAGQTVENRVELQAPLRWVGVRAGVGAVGVAGTVHELAGMLQVCCCCKGPQARGAPPC